MSLLVIGGGGMLGHELWRQAARRDAWVAVRRAPENNLLYASDRVVRMDVSAFDSVIDVIARVRPTVVVNCVGIVKQVTGASAPVPSITVNALFPHRLAELCREMGARLIHISTDCVFSGRRGFYSEFDQADAEDLYGRTKLLGEVTGPGCLTLRTSIIGRELSRPTHGLLEWALAARGRVRGFRHAVFSGVTTTVLSTLILRLIDDFIHLEGLYHVAAEPIDKDTLLRRIVDAFQLPVEVDAVDEPRLDRSLDGRRLTAETGWVAPSWADMIADLPGSRRAS